MMKSAFKILCNLSVLLLLVNFSWATLKYEVDLLSCESNTKYPQIFSVNHGSIGRAHRRLDEKICNNVRASCCTETEFNDLLHYWDKNNSDNNYSREQREYAYWLYSIATTYYEQVNFS